jgi:ribosomal protection tetracycline resistance protein
VSLLNLGILAHVDAGKTSLTERLLFAAGVIGEIGRVDDGSTQTDSLVLERQRGITIKSAVVSFSIGDVTVNLIDTPGHPDFIAEVERVLSVLDGAVLVVSAVEGVQAQTRILMRALRRLGIPALIFVNKIDRGGARPGGVLADIIRKLTPSAIGMGSVRDAGTRQAAFIPDRLADAGGLVGGRADVGFVPDGPAAAAPRPDSPADSDGPADAGDLAAGGFAARLADVLADHDDELLAAWVADEGAVSWRELRAALRTQVRAGLVHPVFFGSAVTGAGVPELTAGIRELLPVASGDPCGPVAGTVFKVERGPAGEKVAYARMFSGTVRARDRLAFGAGQTGKVTAISAFGQRGSGQRGSGQRDPGQLGSGQRGSGQRDPGEGTAARGSVGAGQIARLWGLHEVRIGDVIGGSDAAPVPHYFAPPTLETVVVPGRPADKGALHAALAQLAEQDPLINLRQDDVGHDDVVSLYGEVQKEVIQATLASDFGIEAAFRETTTICIERVTGTGAAVEYIGVPPNPFLAGVGLRVDPAPADSGVTYRLEIEPGALPLSFRRAIEDTVQATLQRGGRYGWQVTDCTVTLSHSGYWPRQSHAHGTFDASMSSTAGDFRNLTPLILMRALRQAGTQVCEPVQHFRLEVPADTVGPLWPVLIQLRAVPQAPAQQGDSCVLEGEIPADRVRDLEEQLPGLARGEAVLETAFDHYQPVRGAVPPRRD